MSTSNKLRGGSDSQLTQFKKLWLHSLAESARDYWRSQLASDSTQAELRKQILAKLKINLVADKQLTSFRHWVEEQDERDAEAQRQIEEEAKLKAEFGDWTLDQIREEVLKRSYARAMAKGDFAAGRKTIVQDLNVKKVALDERKLVLLEKKAAAYDRAQAALTEAKNSSGGITPETLTKIERELKLL